MLGKERPVIPNVCPWWTSGGKARFGTVVSPDELIEDQVAPAMRMGASGLVLWGSLGYTIRRVTDPDQKKYSAEKYFGTPEWRAAIVADYIGGRSPRDWPLPGVRAGCGGAVWHDGPGHRGHPQLAQFQPTVRVGCRFLCLT
jgi:hypothetical protein